MIYGRCPRSWFISHFRTSPTIMSAYSVHKTYPTYRTYIQKEHRLRAFIDPMRRSSPYRQSWPVATSGGPALDRVHQPGHPRPVLARLARPDSCTPSAQQQHTKSVASPYSRLVSRDRPRRVCQCGHSRAAHQHYRSGSECSLCSDCPRYRASLPSVTRLITWMAKRRAGRSGPSASR